MIVHEMAGFSEIFPGYLGQEAAAAPAANQFIIPEGPDATSVVLFYDAVDKGFSKAKESIDVARKGDLAAARAVLSDPKDGFAYWNDQAFAQIKSSRDSGFFTPDEASQIVRDVLYPLGNAGAEASKLLGEKTVASSDALLSLWTKIEDWAIGVVAKTASFWSPMWNGFIRSYATIVKLNRTTTERLNELKGLTQDASILEALKDLEASHNRYVAIQKVIETRAQAAGISMATIEKAVRDAGLGAAGSPGPIISAVVGITGAAASAIKVILGFLKTIGSLSITILGFEIAGRGGRLPSNLLPRYKALLADIEIAKSQREPQEIIQWGEELESKLPHKRLRDGLRRGMLEDSHLFESGVISMLSEGERAKYRTYAEGELGRDEAAEKAAIQAAKEGKSMDEIRRAGDQASLTYSPTNYFAYVAGFGLAGVALALGIYYFTHRDR